MKKDKKNKLRALFRNKKVVVIFLVAVTAVLGWRYFVDKKNGDFETAQIQKGVVAQEIILSGDVQADEHAKLNFLSSGELDYIAVKEGDRVEKGDLLARLDTTTLYQAFLSAEADLRRYEASLDKTYDDVQGHDEDESFAQRETRTVAETNKDKAYRAFVIAQKNLANASLRAPFNGVITNITNPFTGYNMFSTESQIEILNPDTLYFDVSADQSEIIDIHEGQKVVIILDPFSDIQMRGEVAYISLTPVTGEAGAMYDVKVKLIENGSEISKLRVGMTGDAKFIISEKDEVLYVPPSFVNSDSDGKYVNKGKGNNKVYVVVGLESEDRVEIISDELKEGDTVYD